jgi:hypothetical protein
VQTHFLTAGNNLLAVASKWPGPFVSWNSNRQTATKRLITTKLH